jgi:hypothetical protein
MNSYRRARYFRLKRHKGGAEPRNFLQIGAELGSEALENAIFGRRQPEKSQIFKGAFLNDLNGVFKKRLNEF